MERILDEVEQEFGSMNVQLCDPIMEHLFSSTFFESVPPGIGGTVRNVLKQG